MSSLAEHVDRISYLAQSIRSAAAPSASTSGAGPFTDAQCCARHSPSAPPHGEIARVPFVGATPLRQPPAPRPGKQDTQRVGEHEPEVYARAALKYLERYQSIRPMPRASEQVANIIEQLETVRENIHLLNDALKQRANTGPSEPPLSPKSILKQEERRIQDVQAQVTELRRREETFWNTPGAAARTLHFTGDSLLDENVSLADVSALSFASPIPTRAKPTHKPTSASRESPAERDADDIEGSTAEVSPKTSNGIQPEARLEEEDEEQTVVLRRPAPPPIQADAPDNSSFVSISPDTGTASPEQAESLPAEAPSGRPKVKVTTELESIIARIWATIGEIIMPGHPFDVSGSGKGGGKPPRAKETIAHLKTLSTRMPTPTSPTGSSLSSLSHVPPPADGAPTAQQVLTAHLLLELLGTPPAYAMSLNRLKEALSARTKGRGASLGGVAITRPIYGCVAKRLLKIDRGAREQVVKFDLGS
ncbi:hypothetical protein B0H21DRAFT_781976 [Amylocystis lapponica]|nr:hypothetical protein B0H21DRAFT_781976 [Amylocystis lapponica]